MAIIFRSSATSTGSTITAPSEVYLGDLMVLFDVAVHTTEPALVTPSGFTSKFDQNVVPSSNIKLNVSIRIATGSEPSTVYTGMDGNVTDNKIMLVFSPEALNEFTAVGSAGDAEFTGSSGDPASQLCSASGGAAPLIVFGIYGVSGLTTRSMSPSATGEVLLGVSSLAVKYKIYDSAPADVTVDQGDEGALNVLGSLYLPVTIEEGEEPSVGAFSVLETNIVR